MASPVPTVSSMINYRGHAACTRLYRPAFEQKALPDRQVCELVDRYYAGWKETEGYKQLKEKIQ